MTSRAGRPRKNPTDPKWRSAPTEAQKIAEIQELIAHTTPELKYYENLARRILLIASAPNAEETKQRKENDR